MQPGQELLLKWDARARGLHPRMEIFGEGLMLGAGTMLAGMTQDERGRQRLVIDDGPRVMALLATAFDRPVAPYVLEKICRAAELWNEGDKALAHIHLAHAGLPPCGEVRALRLFVADELIEAGVTPETLMKARSFDPAQPGILKFFPAQPRVPAGNGRESGEWTSGDWSGGDGNITPVAFRGRREKGRHRGGRGGLDSIRSFLEWLRKPSKPNETEPAPEVKPHSERENAGTSVKPFGSLEEDLPQPGYREKVSIPGLPDSVKGIDTTDPGAGMPNYKLDMSLSEFEDELLELGWTEEPSSDGKAMIFTKDGAKYSVRDFSNSTDGPTAEFFHPFRNRNRTKADMKLRLRND